MRMRMSRPRSTKMPGNLLRQLPALALPKSAALAPDSSASMMTKPTTVAAIFAQVPCASACAPLARLNWSTSRYTAPAGSNQFRSSPTGLA